MKFTFLFVCFCLTLCFARGARILAIFPTPSLSHHIVYRSLMEELARRGHSLTIVTTDPAKYTDPVYENLTQIDLHELTYSIYNKSFDFVDATITELSPRKVLQNYYNMLVEICDAQYSTPEMQKLLHDKDEHFDLVIAEGIVPVGSAFKEKFKAPLILISSLALAPQHLDIIGNPGHPTLHPDPFAAYDPYDTSIWDRLYLIYRHVMYRLHWYVIYLPQFDRLVKKYFGSDMKSIYAIENEVDMLFVNYHHLWHGPCPLVPAVVSITNIHIKPPKPLPDEMQKFLDEAKEGVIYFSFGSNVKSAHLPEEKRKIFLDVFRQLPYKVIWKWEDDNLPGKPENVIINKWFPQMSILAHPNVKAFITQGGQQSIEEAIWCKVPMLGIPFLFDQVANVFRINKRGIGISLPLENLDVVTLKESLVSVVTNQKYRDGITKFRDLLYDQPRTPLENAVWWTEHVIKHKGARHLRSAAADASFIKYFLLDIAFFIAVCVVLVVYSVIKMRRVFSKYSIKVKTGNVKKSL